VRGQLAAQFDAGQRPLVEQRLPGTAHRADVQPGDTAGERARAKAALQHRLQERPNRQAVTRSDEMQGAAL